jgi:hypothetical protein
VQRADLAHLVRQQLLGDGLAAKGRTAVDERVQGGAQAVEVGADVRLVAVQGLLGGDVVGRAQHGVVGKAARQVVLGVREEAGQTHVQHFNDP